MDITEQKVENILTEFGVRTLTVFQSGFNFEARYFDASGGLRAITIFGPDVRTEDDLRRLIKHQF
jgi:hypothetical protein